MTEQHPITPPLELVEQWECEYHHMAYGPDLSIFISEKAARWGADQELEACCDWLEEDNPGGFWSGRLRAARRPYPTLKEQALELLNKVATYELMGNAASDNRLSITDCNIIRRALESLPS